MIKFLLLARNQTRLQSASFNTSTLTSYKGNKRRAPVKTRPPLLIPDMFRQLEQKSQKHKELLRVKGPLPSAIVNENFQFQINSALLALKRSPLKKDYNDVLKIFELYKSDLNCVNLSTLLSILGHTKRKSEIVAIRQDERFQMIVLLIIEKLSEGEWWNSQSLSSSLYILGKMVGMKGGVVEPGEKSFSTCDNTKIYEIFDFVNSNMADFLISKGSTHEIAMTVWSCAAVKHFAPNIFRAVSADRERIIEECNPQEMSLICWSFATTRHDDPELFDLIAKNSSKVLAGGPQVISNVAWSFASNKVRNLDLFRSIAGRSDLLLLDGNPQAIANTMWAFAVLGIYDGVVVNLWEALVNCTDDEQAGMKVSE